MPQKPESALSAFTQIGESIYLYDAPVTSSTATSSSNQGPDTIILFSWMGASNNAICKYIDGYKSLFPHARIILVRTEVNEYLFRRDAEHRKNLATVVSAVQARADRDPKIMAVCYSNDGALKICMLAEAYLQTTGSVLPMQAMLLDSCPAKLDLQQSVAALQLGLPSTWFIYYPALVAVYGFLAVMVGYFTVTGRDSVLERCGKGLNDPGIVDAGARRCYIYSKEDKITGWKDVVNHAEDARKKGWKVKTELFRGSQHSAHVRVNSERYWAAVKDLWFTRPSV